MPAAIVARGPSQRGSQVAVYELDTLRLKVRGYSGGDLAPVSIVTPILGQAITTEQCQVPRGAV